MRSCEAAIVAFSNKISEFLDLDQGFADEMTRRVANAAQFCQTPQVQESSFVATMKQFAEECDWEGLEMIALRYASNEDPGVQHAASSYLCLALANSDYPEKHAEANAVADGLVGREEATIDDYRLCFSVNRKIGRDPRAQEVLLEAANRFGHLPPDFQAVAMQFAMESGNKELRNLLSPGIGGTDE
ncbi:MAG: hypothetical protein JNM43_23745 [Planctomycetaceae bacterium]|nr:hypothetical protein [Planctomycetaceae bacterium]